MNSWKIIAILYLIVLSIPGFGGSEESAAAEKLLECFDQGDAEQLKACTSQPLFKYLDNEVTLAIVATTALHFTSVKLKKESILDT